MVCFSVWLSAELEIFESCLALLVPLLSSSLTTVVLHHDCMVVSTFWHWTGDMIAEPPFQSVVVKFFLFNLSWISHHWTHIQGFGKQQLRQLQLYNSDWHCVHICRWTTLTGRVRAQRLFGKVGHQQKDTVNDNSQSRAPTVKRKKWLDYAGRLLDSSLYALCLRSRIQLGPHTSLSASSELDSLSSSTTDHEEADFDDRLPWRGRVALRHKVKLLNFFLLYGLLYPMGFLLHVARMPTTYLLFSI